MARAKAVKSETQPGKATWGESYTSLLLGMIVVVVIGFIIFSFVGRNKEEKTKQTSSTMDNVNAQEQKDKQPNSSLPKTYTVVLGDNLWSIAENLYKSGYNWVDIAKANNLANPDVLEVGNKLTIPDIAPKESTIEQKTKQASLVNAIKGDSYTVVTGDSLWQISVRAYGDGYKWVEIAKVNKLDNPDLIFSGNKLKIPR